MVRHAALGICLIALLAIVAFAPTRAAAQEAPCTQATFQNIFNDITSWTDVHTYPAGTAAKSLPNLTGLAPTSGTISVAICRLAFTIQDYIDVEVWLPLSGWNGRLEGTGNGGLAGAITYSGGTVGGDLVTATSLGYAAVGTDTGHISNCANPCPPPTPVFLGNSWWTSAPQLIDNGYLAIHEMTVKAKAFVQAFYNTAPKYSYYNGCSTGGREGFMEAQRYPTDYNGIATGSPVFHVLPLRSRHVWTWQCNWENASGANSIPFASTTFNGTTYNVGKLTTIFNAVVKKCQGQDGLNDGLVWDPRVCHFEPATIQCPAGTDNVTCLNPNQVQTLQCMYRGPGQYLYPGIQKSSELDQGQNIGTVPNPQYTTFFQYTVFWNVLDQNGAPNFNFTNFTFPGDYNYTLSQVWGFDTLDDEQDAANPNVSAFMNSGGKWIAYQPTADPLPSAVDTIGYYNSVRALLGNSQTENFFRLFMVPNAGHCLGTSAGGPTNIDPLTALVNWVENGVAPAQLIASTPSASYSVPLCPYPQVTKYSGSGSTTSASSFTCVQGPQWTRPVQTATHDFNADVISDVLWRDNQGNVGTWLMNGTSVASATMLGNVPLTWSAVGLRDFNGDGYADVLWRDSAGDVGIWLMDGATVSQATMLGNVPTTWSVAATGDFNGDGFADILWRDTAGNVGIWFMNGTSNVALNTPGTSSSVSILSTAVIGNVPLTWTIAGSDSNGDIFWRNTATGDVAMWTMNGSTVTQSVDLGTVPLNWTIAGVGDFDGNGSADILWRDNSGNVGIWLMNGTSILSTAVLGNVPLNWTIAQTGDYNGDGNSDIMWTDNSGNVGVWFMNGTTVSSTTLYGNVGTAWSVQALNAD
jgi:feruloyl esterase